MNKVTLLILALFGFMTMNGQAQMSVAATVGLQVPLGDFATGRNMGLGFTIIGKYMVKDNLALGASVGFSQFSTDGVGGVNISIMPITGLAEYHFGESSMRPYVGADLGVYTTTSSGVNGVGVNFSNSDSNFGFAPTVGLVFGKSESLTFMVNGKYNTIVGEGASSSWLGVNLGAIFQL